MFKLASEILPFAVFFISYKVKGIFFATFTTLIVSVIYNILYYIILKKITIIQILYSSFLLIFGSITLVTKDPAFIKMKPTILYLVIALIIFISDKLGTPVIKKISKDLIAFDKASQWSVLSNRFGFFYLTLAICNELIWRNYSEIIWVRFKIFGVLPLIMFFMLIQMPFILKNNTKNNKLQNRK